MSNNETFRFFGCNPDHTHTHRAGKPCGERDCVIYNCKCGGKVHSEKMGHLYGFAYHCEKCNAMAAGHQKPRWVKND